jgi:Ca2+-binding EF-hand superfamily protein
VGTAYGKQLLTRIERQPLLSTPRSQWLSLAISPEERSRLVHGMSTRDQAMYAFYAGDDATVAQLLGSVNPEKASLEEMFLVAFAYDALGLDKPELTREWYNRIASRYPDSPWAKSAQEFLAASEENHKLKARQDRLLTKYDLNHNGILDQAERAVMERDPAYQREEKAVRQDELDAQLQAIFKKYDRSGDGRLDRDELEAIRNTVRMFSEAPPSMLAGRKILVAPLLTRDFPPAAQILKKYDANKDGALDAAEFKALAVDIQKKAQLQ